jgi:ABC-type amino acid transport system permease subunit
MAFTISANSTQVPSISIQTGTVSGAILAHMTLQAGGAEIPVSDVTIQIARNAPVIRSVTLTRSTATLQLTIAGYASPREVTLAVFHFNPSAASTVQITDVTMDASSLFGPWFQSANSTQYGSQFTYTQTLNVQGDVNQIGSIVVTLANSAGASQPATSN